MSFKQKICGGSSDGCARSFSASSKKKNNGPSGSWTSVLGHMKLKWICALKEQSQCQSVLNQASGALTGPSVELAIIH